LSFAERLGELPFSLMYYHDIWTEGTAPCRTVAIAGFDIAGLSSEC